MNSVERTMERNREGRRAAVAAVNGGGLSRRRQQRYRESPENDGAMEMQERLRERGINKKDHRERSIRRKRRKGDRMLQQQQHASNRDDGDESSSESADDEEEDDVRHPPPPPSNTVTAQAVQHNHNHHRKSFPMTVEVAQSAAGWKTADEMIGVPVPRRARSSSAKRPQEFSYSGSGGGGEPIHRQTSSPARPSPSNTPILQSSSVRKKMKPATGMKHRPTKMSKSSAVTEDLEIEVAEVLFGLTRQFQSPVAEQETTHKFDPQETNGPGNEAKSRVSSPHSISNPSASLQPSVLPPPSLGSNTAPVSTAVPKRKRHRPSGKLEDENPTSTSACSITKMEPELEVTTEASSPKSEKNTAPAAVENGRYPSVVFSSAKPESNPAPDLKFSTRALDSGARTEIKEEAVSHAKESHRVDLDPNLNETSATTKSAPAVDSSQEVKFSIDLMASPPRKSSPEMEDFSEQASNQKAPVVPDIDIAANFSISLVDVMKAEEVKAGKMAKPEVGEVSGAGVTEKLMPQDFHLKNKIEKDRALDFQLDFGEAYNDSLGTSKLTHKQQQNATKAEPKPEKAAQSSPLPLPVPVGGWPVSFPPFGYMGQVPSMQPVAMDRSSGSAKTPPNYLSAQLRPKRCATQCYIAHNIRYHQQLSRMNPFWPAAACTAPVQGGKQCNLNAVPPSESLILGNLSQAKTSGSMQDKGGSLTASKDKTSAGNTFMEAAQRKQPVLQQAPQPGPGTNMMHGPTFIFPLSQQQAAAAAAARSGATKPPLGSANAASSSSSPSSALLGSTTGGHAASMSFNYPGMPPNEAQYMAILQNGAYPFPIPAHVGAPPQYRGGSAQSMPFFNGSFYSPHMLHPPQLQQQQQQAPQQLSHSHAQQGHQNTSTSSGSSSSQRPPQQPERSPGSAAATMGSSHIVPASKKKQQQLPIKCETGSEDSPSTASSKALQLQKSIFSYNLDTAIHPQSFALVSPALGSGGGSHGEKPQPLPQHQSMKVDMTTSQAFAMSFASFGGATATPLQGLNFTSIAQNHAIFQSLPEAARHGYQFAAAAGGASPATQNKKPHRQVSEDGKSAGDRINSNTTTGEEERNKTTTSKSPASAPQHSFTFSRPDHDPSVSNILGNTVVDSSSRTLNLIQAPGNGGRVSSRPATAAPTNSSFATTAAPVPSQLQQQVQQQRLQQQMFQLQKQQRQFLQQQQQQLVNRTKTSTSTPSATIYSDHLPAGSAMAKFPQSVAGFPQALVQGGGATQSPQWKTSTRGTTPAVAVSLPSSTAKNQLPKQQSRSMQQPFLPQGHQTHISFGTNSSKASTPTGQQHHAAVGSNPSLSQSSASKNVGGSPRSVSTKPGTSQATMFSLQQQQQQPMKISPSSSGLKSSPLSNGSPSTRAPNANSKQQQQTQSQQQQVQKQQPIPQTQFFFSNPYSNGATVSGYYHPKHQPEQQSPQQQAQQNSAPGSTGNLSLCSSGQTLASTPPGSDPPKAAAVSDMKGITAAGLMQHHTQFAAMAQPVSGTAHTLMSASAVAGTFPYMHAMPSVSAKPNEQKPAAA